MRRARISRTRFRRRLSERRSRVAISATETPRLRRLMIRASRSALFSRVALPAATDLSRETRRGQGRAETGFETSRVIRTNIERNLLHGKKMSIPNQAPEQTAFGSTRHEAALGERGWRGQRPRLQQPVPPSAVASNEVRRRRLHPFRAPCAISDKASNSGPRTGIRTWKTSPMT